MTGRAQGRARGRTAAPLGEALHGSPSPPGSGRGSPKDEDNGGGNSDAIRGRASYHPGLLVTKPEGKQSQAVDAVGQETGLFANHFKIRTSMTRVLSDYRVDFEPNVELRKTRRMMVATQAEVFGNAYVFDGMHNLKSTTDAPEAHEVLIRNEVTGEPVKLTFKRTGEINWFDEEMLRFLNMQLRRNFEKLKYLLIFRHYFDLSQTTDMPNYDLRIMRGLATAVARHDSGLMMVCDTVSKVIHSKTVMDLMSDIRKRHPQDFANVVRQKIPGQIVMTTYNNRTYRVSDVDFTQTAESTFERRGIQTSYIDYYRDHYSITVLIPRQPLLVVNLTSRDIRFATQNGRPAPTPISLLPEFCVITGLTEDQQSDQTLKRTMTQTTQVDPSGRFQALKDFAGKLQGNPEVQKSLKQWDIAYAPMPLQIKGRVLPPEHVYMDGDTTWQRPIAFNSEQASFEREMRSKKMFDPGNAAEAKEWVIFVSRRNESDAHDFAQMLNRVSGPLGMKLSKPMLEVLQDDRPSAYSAALQSNVASNCQLVVCIVPNNDKARYDLIKKFCYIQKGVASQVVVGRTLVKKQQLMSVCTKVGIQVATKLGAAPWSFKIPPKNLMVIGFDTYHDGARRGESVGALVASLNGSLTRYHSRVTYHRNKDEMSSGVANLFRGKSSFVFNLKLISFCSFLFPLF